MSKGPTRWEWMQAVLSADGPTGQVGSRHDFDSVTGQAVRLTLCALGQHMDPSGGSCFPSIPLLAVETSLGERTVRRALQWAVEEGWVDRQARGRGYIYRPVIPAALAGIEGNGHRPPWPQSDNDTPAALAGVPIPAALATVANHAPDSGQPSTEHRPPWPPSSTSEVAKEVVSSPVSSTLPPTSSGEQRREDVAHLDRARIRTLLRDVCLLGDDQGTLPDGTVVGIGLLLEQWDDYVPRLIDAETFVAMVGLVRSDDDAPGRLECFTLRWFKHGDRLGRIESRARRAAYRPYHEIVANDPDMSAEIRELARSKAMPPTRPEDRDAP